MWELSIAVDLKNLEVAKFIYQTLKSRSAEYETVVTCYEQFDTIFVLLACPENFQARVSVEVERCIIKAICDFYKEKFLAENLRLPLHENMSLMAFKKALINFDKETDFYLITKNLELKSNLHLDSFYHFKLKGLREKWSELISLANENSDYLVSNEAFFDLLKFLIDNLEVCADEINVFEDENGYFIKPQNREDEAEYQSLSKEGLVSSLIELSPKKINLFCCSDDNTTGFLAKIFEERVNICYNKSLEKIENFSFLK
ncbi:MAG: hypothetical protein J6J24_00770 [Clostridia bacterium]|nr:hypothetical protein [Clostridia bacterium]